VAPNEELGQGTLQVPRVCFPFYALSIDQLHCSVQGLVRSHQKTDLLKGYGDTVLHAEALEKELEKSKKHSALLQSKLDSTFAQYHNEVQEM
jgi:hypothetical protein